MFANFDLGVFLLVVLPVLLAITVREVACGHTARYWGDHTGGQLGRLTLNPLPHIGPVDTIVMPLVYLMIGSFLFGWARPMSIDSRNFRDPHRAWHWVSILSPIASLILVFFWGFVVVLTAYVPESYQTPLTQMADYGVVVNSIWVVFSLIPILPWDGGIFIDTFPNAEQSMQFRKIEPYGTWVILIPLFTGLLTKLIRPTIDMVQTAVQMVVMSFIQMFWLKRPSGTQFQTAFSLCNT